MIDDRLVLKVFRKLEPGINPELELLRFLTAHEFPNIAELHGWYELRRSRAGVDARRRPAVPSGGGHGWDLALERIAGEPEWLLDQLGGLGTVTAQLHTVLASDAGDPDVRARGTEPGGAVDC